MGSLPALALPVPPVADVEEDAVAADRGAIARLGAWVAILGAARVAVEVVVYASNFRAALGSGLIASWGWAGFLNANPPVGVLLGAWPLLLGLALWRTRWLDLVKVGALTFLVLSVGGLLSVVADLSHNPGRWIAVGSFRIPKIGWSRLTSTEIAMATTGAVQLLLELGTAVYAFVLAWSHDGDGRPVDGFAAARRSWFIRFAIYVPVAVLALTIRLPAWSTLMEMLSQSQWVREFILRDDLARLRSTRKSRAPESEWAAQARLMLNEGEQAWLAQRFAEASEHFSRLAGLLNTIPTADMNMSERRLAARSLNDWAWLLVTCPETSLRNNADSVKYARRALELEPNDYAIWNTLGVGYYRLGAWDDALSALYRSMELRDEGDSNDWFFLAMIHERLGHKDRAREWYDKAVQWAHTAAPGNEELYRFEVEAAETLGLPEPERRPPPVGRRIVPRPFGLPGGPGRRGRMGPRAPTADQSADATGSPATPGRRQRTLI